MVILEAMMYSLPIIATRVGALADVIRPETGVLVEPKAPEARQQTANTAASTATAQIGLILSIANREEYRACAGDLSTCFCADRTLRCIVWFGEGSRQQGR